MEIDLRTIRASLRLSRKALAAELGVTEDTIYNWEHGKSSPRLETAVKLIRYLESRGVKIAADKLIFF